MPSGKPARPTSAVTPAREADRQTVIASLLSGQYEGPLKIVAFNTQEGWARDVTAEIAAAISGRIYDSDEDGAMSNAGVRIDNPSREYSRPLLFVVPHRGCFFDAPRADSNYRNLESDRNTKKACTTSTQAFSC